MKKTILAIAATVMVLNIPAYGQSLDIRQCREMAMERNSAAVNASLDVVSARYMKQEAFAEYFPRVNFTALGFMSLNPLVEIGIKDIFGNNDFSNNLQSLVDYYAPMYGIKTSYSALERGYLAGISIMQPVYAGGRIVHGNRLASIGIEAAELSRDLQKRKTGDEIEEMFNQVVSLEEKMRTLAEFREFVDTLHKDVASAYAAGLSTEDNLLQVQLKSNELRASEIQLRNGIRLSRMNLFNAIGQPYTVISSASSADRPYIDSITIVHEEEIPLPPEHWYRDEEQISTSLEESRLLDLNVEAKRIQKRMEMGGTLPQLAVGISYGYSGLLGDGRFNGMAFATLQVPLSDWGKTALKMKRMQIDIDKAANERDYLDSQLLLQVRKYWLDLGTAWDSYQVSMDSRRVAQVAFDNTRSHYEAGMVSLSELLQARATLRQTEEDAAEALAAYRQALRTWQEISGTGDECTQAAE